MVNIGLEPTLSIIIGPQITKIHRILTVGGKGDSFDKIFVVAWKLVETDQQVGIHWDLGFGHLLQCLKYGYAGLAAVYDLEVFDPDLIVPILQRVVSEFVTGKGNTVIIEIEIAILVSSQCISHRFINPVTF